MNQIYEKLGKTTVDFLMQKYEKGYSSTNISEELDYFGHVYLMSFSLPENYKLDDMKTQEMQSKMGTPFVFHDGKFHGLKFYKSDEKAQEWKERYEKWENVSNVEIEEVSL